MLRARPQDEKHKKKKASYPRPRKTDKISFKEFIHHLGNFLEEIHDDLDYLSKYKEDENTKPFWNKIYHKYFINKYPISELYENDKRFERINKILDGILDDLNKNNRNLVFKFALADTERRGKNKKIKYSAYLLTRDDIEKIEKTRMSVITERNSRIKTLPNYRHLEKKLSIMFKKLKLNILKRKFKDRKKEKISINPIKQTVRCLSMLWLAAGDIVKAGGGAIQEPRNIKYRTDYPEIWRAEKLLFFNDMGMDMDQNRKCIIRANDGSELYLYISFKNRIAKKREAEKEMEKAYKKIRQISLVKLLENLSKESRSIDEKKLFGNLIKNVENLNNSFAFEYE